MAGCYPGDAGVWIPSGSTLPNVFKPSISVRLYEKNEGVSSLLLMRLAIQTEIFALRR